jgi:hypothetical protein
MFNTLRFFDTDALKAEWKRRESSDKVRVKCPVCNGASFIVTCKFKRLECTTCFGTGELMAVRAE